VFCLGSVLAFAASGRAPFSGAAAAAVLYQVVHGSPDLTEVPDPIDKIVGLCLAKDPGLRLSPDRLSAACAPGGAELMFEEGWLPEAVTASIAGYTAAVMDLDLEAQSRITVAVNGADSLSPGYGGGYRGRGAYSAPAARQAYAAAGEAPCAVGTVTESPETGPASFPGAPEPVRPAPSVHRKTSGRGVSRRRIIAASAATAVVGGAGLLIARRETGGQTVQPLGRAPEPAWIHRGGPFLQAPAVFNGETALLKSRPGKLLCLDLKDGTRPKWEYEGISLSPTPPLLINDAVVALGAGATVIGVDPGSGAEKFALDFGQDFRFDAVFGSYDDKVVSAIGVRFQRQSAEQGVATTTNTVFGIDLQARRALVIPISAEDIGIPLNPVVTDDYFIYADGLRNVAVRRTADGGGVAWRYHVGYDLRPGLAVLGQTVFAIGAELLALDLASGKVRWRVKAERGQFASLGVAGNTVYVTGTDPCGVYAFNGASGARRWFCETPRLNVDKPVTVGPRTVYVPAFQNNDGFFAIDAASGKLLWNFTDGRETGVNDWQLSCDADGHVVAQHFDRVYGLPAA